MSKILRPLAAVGLGALAPALAMVLATTLASGAARAADVNVISFQPSAFSKDYLSVGSARTAALPSLAPVSRACAGVPKR